MCEPYGYDESHEYLSKRTQLDNELEVNRQNDDKAFASVEYNSTLNAFVFKNVDGEERGYAYVSDMLSQDFIKDFYYDSETKKLIITLVNDKTIEIPFEDIIDITDAGDGLYLDDNKFSIRLNENCEQYLSVDENGLLLSGVTDAINEEASRALSAETEIENALEAERERAVQAEKDISTALAVEATNRANEDGIIKQIIGDGYSTASTETVAYKQSELDSRLEKEIQDRQTADQALERMVALKADIADVYNKDEVDELINKIVAESGDSYSKDEIDEKLSIYATEDWVNEQGFLKEHQSLAEYAKTSEVDEKLAEKADKSEIPTDFYSRQMVDEMISQLMTRIENVESVNGVVVSDSADGVLGAASGSNLVLTSAAAVNALTSATEYNTLTIVGGACDTDVKAIVGDKITIDGLTAEGDKGNSNGRMQISAATVDMKNVMVADGSTMYNVFESSQNTSKDEYHTQLYNASNIKVDDVDLKHNVFNIYTFKNDAVVNISDSSFNLDVDCSNVLRLSNYANATGVTVNISNVDWTYENAEGSDWRWAGLVIYQPAGNDKALSGDTSALSTWTINIENCRYNGEKVDANNFGSHSQVVYIYNMNDDGEIIDATGKLNINFK